VVSKGGAQISRRAGARLASQRVACTSDSLLISAVHPWWSDIAACLSACRTTNNQTRQQQAQTRPAEAAAPCAACPACVVPQLAASGCWSASSAALSKLKGNILTQSGGMRRRGLSRTTCCRSNDCRVTRSALAHAADRDRLAPTDSNRAWVCMRARRKGTGAGLFFSRDLRGFSEEAAAQSSRASLPVSRVSDKYTHTLFGLLQVFVWPK
jgi:hypothetical protein